MLRKRRKTPNKIVIVCAVIAVVLCAFSLLFSLTATPDPLRAAAVTLSTPLTRAFDAVGGAVHDLFYPTPDELALQAQIDQLQAALTAERQKTQQLQQLRLENEQLREFLSLSDAQSQLSLCQARRIYTSDTSKTCITLDRGTRDGVRVGMPVLDHAGLIGVVSEVYRTSCKVRTLLDEAVFVGVRDARSGVSGTLCAADDGQGLCTLKYLDANIDHTRALRVGDVIVTAGESDIYPADLAVGEIVKVGLDSYDRSPYALVKLYADVSDPTARCMIVTGERVVQDEPAQDPIDEPVDPIDPIDPVEPTDPIDPSQDEQTTGDEDAVPLEPEHGEVSE